MITSTPNFDQRRLVNGFFSLKTSLFLVIAIDCSLSLALAVADLWTGHRLGYLLHFFEVALAVAVIGAVMKCRPRWIIAYLAYSAVDISYTALVNLPAILSKGFGVIKSSDLLRQGFTTCLVVENIYLAVVIIAWCVVLIGLIELRKDAEENEAKGEGNAKQMTFSITTMDGNFNGRSSAGINAPFRRNNALEEVSSTVSSISAVSAAP